VIGHQTLGSGSDCPNEWCDGGGLSLARDGERREEEDHKRDG